MRLDRLRLVNFRQHAATDIAFGPGITGIIGPNGAGKTTLLEAIAWAFYGTPAARGGRDSLRFDRAPPRSSVRVEVEFGLGAHEYRVVRTLYEAELYLDRGGTPVSNSAVEVTARVQQALGLARDEFFNTYFTGQKELAVMASLGAADRGRFLSRLMGYERLRLAQERLRDARTELKGVLTGVEQGLSDPAVLTRELEEAQARRSAACDAVRDAERTRKTALDRREIEGPAWSAMVRLRESVLALDGDRRVAESKVEQARREFQRLDRDLVEALGAQSALKDLEPQLTDVPVLREELDRLEAEARTAGRRRELLGRLAAQRAQGERLAERLGGLGDVAKGLAAARASVEAERTQLAAREAAEQAAHTAWVRDKQDAETKREQLRAQYKALQEDRRRITTAGRDGACPTCTRPLREEYETVLGALDRQLEEIELNGKFYAQRVEQLAEPPEEVGTSRAAAGASRAALERAREAQAAAQAREHEARDLAAELARVRSGIAALEAEVAALPDAYDAARHDVVRERLRERQPLLDRATTLRVKAERAELLVREAEAADRTLSERETRLKELERHIADLDFSEERYAAARVAYEAAERAVQEAEVAVRTREAEARAAQAAVEAVTRRMAERERQAARAQEVRTEIRVHDELDDAFGDLRTDLNAQLRPELAEVASSFLAELTDGRYHELELDEHYRLLVLEDGEPRPVISGGEEDIANLVLRLAISQMVAERAGQPLSLLVLDEIFGSLDEQRREHVVALLRRLADRFPQVILITHIESVRDSVDRVLRVAVDPATGAAVVREAPGADDEEAAA
jgi:exonuclease SbcC